MNNTAKLAALEVLYAQLPKIECQRKCHESCGPIVMTRLEARRLPELSFEKMMMKHKSGPPLQGIGFLSIVPASLTCPLLKNGACAAYDRRPAICRLWGLTEKLRCPFGCEPSVRWTEQQAYEWIAAVSKIGV